MRARELGLLLVLAAGGGGCVSAACIQRGGNWQYDRCVDDSDSFVCELFSEESCSDEADLPIRCDDYKLATTCESEGFEVECGDVWLRAGSSCT